MNSLIERELSILWSDNNQEDDVDRILSAFHRLNAAATQDDLPQLVEAIRSEKSDFWIRELLSEPISRLGGVEYLDELFDALALNYADGHDNDGFCHHLTEIAHFEPERCREKLEVLIKTPDFRYIEHAKWLLEFCNKD